MSDWIRRNSPIAGRPGRGLLSDQLAGARSGGGNGSSCSTPAVRDARPDRLNWVDWVEELGGRGGPADVGVTSDCAASLGGGDCLLSGYELGQLAEVLGDCSEVEFVAGTARPAQP